MRTLSAAVIASFYAQQTGAVLPVLLEITHDVDGYDNPLRIANNYTALTYGGNVYSAFPFKYDPPDQGQETSNANARLTICAVDQTIPALLRQAVGAATVQAIATYWNDESGTVVFEEMAVWTFTLRNVSGTADIVTADLIYEDRLDNAVPAGEFNSHWPGII